jgi:hypothetical protein
MSVNILAGVFLIIVPVAFNIVFFALGSAFEYPAILRQPTEAILKKFSAGGRRLVTLWYAFGVTALLAIPMSLALIPVFYAQNPILSVIAGVLGTLSGLVQAMGMFRWTFLVPILAARYQAQDATPATRDAISVVFEAFHQYIGVAVGEHLGYLFTAGWTILVSVLVIGAPVASPLLAVVGVIAAIGILAGLLEPAGWKPAGMINATAYIVWSLWLIVVGLTLIFAR